MKILINENKEELIYKSFKNMMTPYSKLRKIVRDYDFWHDSKNSYVDYSPINFYDVNDDGDYDDFWEDDDWTFQYAESEPYTGNKIGIYPMLLYPRRMLSNIKELVGTRFEPLFKRWFKETYGLEINKLVDDYEGSQILDIYS